MLFRYLWLRNWSFAGLASIWLVGVVVLVCTLEFDLPLPMFIVGAVIVFLLGVRQAPRPGRTHPGRASHPRSRG